MNEWDVICALAADAVIEVDDDGTYRLVKRMGDVPDHVVTKLLDIGMLRGPNSYRLNDDGRRYYMQRVDGQHHVADPQRHREIAEAERAAAAPTPPLAQGAPDGKEKAKKEPPGKGRPPSTFNLDDAIDRVLPRSDVARSRCRNVPPPPSPSKDKR